MRDPFFAVLGTAVAAGLILVGGAMFFGAPAHSSAAVAPMGPTNSGPTVYRTLTIALDARSGGFVYTAATLNVPLHTRVVFTITNFDPSAAMLPSRSNAMVKGTDGGLMMIDHMAGRTAVSQLAAPDVSHTFSMSNGFYKLNVPVPRADPSGSPAQISFTVVFNVPGTFTWGCVALCGPSDMGASDVMFGTLTVS